MSTFWRYVKIQLFVLLCGIVGPIFLVIYFATGADPMMRWMFWTGLLVTAIDVLIARIVPHTELVRMENAADIHARRKKLFFKPATGFGSKATYRGLNVTNRVLDEIMQGRYVAQELVPLGFQPGKAFAQPDNALAHGPQLPGSRK